MTNSSNLKHTKTRNEILSFISAQTQPVSAADIYSALKNANADLSTIYRTLNTFTKNGTLFKQQDKSGNSVYISNNEHHNHILVCTKCDKKVDLNYCPFHKIHSDISKKTGFEIEDQNTIIYGICPECKKQ